MGNENTVSSILKTTSMWNFERERSVECDKRGIYNLRHSLGRGVLFQSVNHCFGVVWIVGIARMKEQVEDSLAQGDSDSDSNGDNDRKWICGC
jgi:hypothetical protein